MALYHERLDNLFAAYAPEKRGLVSELLQRYSGAEEEMIQGLVKKFGPEPTAWPPGGGSKVVAGGDNYRDRLIRFYGKYAPKKLHAVDKTLARFAGREEELFFAMVKMYGPEPLEPQGPSGATTDATSEANSFMNSVTTTGSSSTYEPYNVHAPKWRLARFLMEYAPEKLLIIDQIMGKYAENEDIMLSNCVERYGPEPLSPDTQNPRARLTRFIEHYVPHKSFSVDILLNRYSGRTEILFGALVKKFGPEPPAPRLFNGPPRPTYGERLVRFYKVYAPERLVNVNTVLERYKGTEEEMFRILVERYGPEPGEDVDPDAPTPPEKDYHARLTRLFTRYAPNRLDTIPLLLAKYKGCEDMIIKALANKLGPEDSIDEPVSNSTSAVAFHQATENGNAVKSAIFGSIPNEIAQDVEHMVKDEECDSQPTDCGGDTQIHSMQCLSAYRSFAVSRLGEERVSALESLFGIIHVTVKGDATVESNALKTSDAITTEVAHQLGEAVTTTDNMVANFACLLLVLETVKFPLAKTFLEEDVFRWYPFCKLLGDRDRFTLKISAALMDMKATFDSATNFLFCEEETTRQRIVQHMNAEREQLCTVKERKESYTWRLLEKAVELLPAFEKKERQEIYAVEQIEFKGKALWFSEGLCTSRRMTEKDFLTTRYEKRLHRWKSLSASNRSSALPMKTVPCATGVGVKSSHDIHDLNWRKKDGRHLILPNGSPGNESPPTSSVIERLVYTAPMRLDESIEMPHSRTARTNGVPCVDTSPPPRNPQVACDFPGHEFRLGGPTTNVRQTSREEAVMPATGRDMWGPARDGRLSQVHFSPCQSRYEAVLLDEMQPALTERQQQHGDSFSEAPRNFRLAPFFFEKEHRFSSSSLA